jgi:hypothetical protein
VLAAADADRVSGGATDDHPARHRRGHPGGQPGRGQPAARRVGPARRPERRSRGPGGVGHVSRTRGARPADDWAARPGGWPRILRYLACLSGVRLTARSRTRPNWRCACRAPPAGTFVHWYQAEGSGELAGRFHHHECLDYGSCCAIGLAEASGVPAEQGALHCLCRRRPASRCWWPIGRARSTRHQIHVIALNTGILIQAAPQIFGEVMVRLPRS